MKLKREMEIEISDMLGKMIIGSQDYKTFKEDFRYESEYQELKKYFKKHCEKKLAKDNDRNYSMLRQEILMMIGEKIDEGIFG